MPLPIPRLDDRTFEDLVQDAKNKIPSLCKQWTDFNDSDPGITLIHLMAYMGETILYRLNRVPERNYLKFLELMGVQLQPAKPARTWVVFDITPGADESAMPVIPSGTRLSTKPEGGQAIEFQTCDSLTLTTTKPIHLFAGIGENIKNHSMILLPPDPQKEQCKPIQLFDAPIRVPHLLYLGDTRFDASLQKARLTLQVTFSKKYAKAFHLEWEIWDGAQWTFFAPSRDETGGFCRDGQIHFESLPVLESTVDGISATWLRARLTGTYSDDLPVIATLKRYVTLEAEYGFRPEAAFICITGAPDQPVDFTKDCFPFGTVPAEHNIFAVKPGNTIYFASPLFGRGRAKITIDVAVPQYHMVPSDALSSVELQWEYYNQNGNWAKLKGVEDGTQSLSRRGFIRFYSPEDIAPFSMQGQSALYIRVRLSAGTYSHGKEHHPPIIGDLKISFSESPVDWGYYKTENYYTCQSQETPTAELPMQPFHVKADSSPTLCLALDKRPSNAAHRLYFDIKICPEMPTAQVVWEYKTQGTWKPLRLIRDDTRGLTQRGALEYIAPADWQPEDELGHTGYWLRGCWTVAEFQQDITLSGIYWNAAEVVQAKTRQNEILDSGKDKPLQMVRFPEAPILPDATILVREIENPGIEQITRHQEKFGNDLIKEPQDAPDEQVKALWVRWKQVDTFFKSSPDDRHYCLDPIEGTIQFGDGRHGRRVPAGTSNIKAEYFQLGGGVRGNVGKGVINVLDQPVAYVKSVKNIFPARGGTDIETLEAAKKRGPWLLKHRDRAVTRKDFETLAMEASAEVALAHCLEALSSNDEVQILILPHDTNNPEDILRPSNRLIRIVEHYLSERCLINTRLKILAPDYIDCEIHVDVVLKKSHLGQFPHVQSVIESKLKGFVHPLKGGPDGDGWPMGRAVHISEMYYLLEQIEGINYVDRIRMAGKGTAQWTEKITLPVNAFPYFKEIEIRQQ